VTQRKIYRTKVGGSSYFLLTTLADNTSTTYTDNIADASLGATDYSSRNNTTAGIFFVNGTWAGCLNTNNTAFGINALGTAFASGGFANVAFGNNALIVNTSGLANAAVGAYALNGNTTGSYNTALGESTLQNNTTGTQNTAVGQQALFNNTTANY